MNQRTFGGGSADGFDTVRDLAIVSGEATGPFLDLHARPLQQGTRVFSLGLPLDLASDASG